MEVTEMPNGGPRSLPGWVCCHVRFRSTYWHSATSSDQLHAPPHNCSRTFIAGVSPDLSGLIRGSRPKKNQPRSSPASYLARRRKQIAQGNVEKALSYIQSGGVCVNTAFEHLLPETLPFGAAALGLLLVGRLMLGALYAS